MKQDILTISRVMRVLSGAGINTDLSLDDAISLVVMMRLIDDANVSGALFDIILEAGESREPDNLMLFFFNIKRELDEFHAEIERRKKHVIDLGIYVEDTEEELLLKLEENKNYYVGDVYLSNYRTLRKEGIEPEKLSLFESMIMIEEIVCNDLNKATSELLSIISSDNPSFCESVRKTIRYANFYSFALDIYNDVDEMYQSIEKKRNSKK